MGYICILNTIQVNAVATDRPTLLIVESDEATRELYRRELGRAYAVIVAESADQALATLQAEHIDAIILDPATSDGAGWALLAAIRSMPSHPLAPVILCSALDERRRGFGLGAVAYLVKPALPSTLLTTVRQVLSVQPERRGV